MQVAEWSKGKQEDKHQRTRGVLNVTVSENTRYNAVLKPNSKAAMCNERSGPENHKPTSVATTMSIFITQETCQWRKEKNMTHETHILVIEGGWVLVGLTEFSDSQVTLTNAHVIRIWGTTKGLGEIALGGPTKKTILDKLGVAFVERKHVRFSIPCDDTKWHL